ncbi:ABC transporter permease [Telmatobacter sp. DSM 110680]|uniref:ABC transporter permease n=1 Tax=Telmatobacter sp. DSM 110680 TaxID=3036704 RepID=A0AAU7DN49_9BACT
MSWLRRLFARKRLEIDLDKELRFHFESQVADKVRSGASENEARRLTRLEFGGIEQIKEDCRESRGTLWVESMVQDIRYAVRQIRNSPGFSIVAILSLTLGIGANTAIFTLLNAILLRPLPVHNPEELQLFGDGRAQGLTLSIPDGPMDLFSKAFLHDFGQKNTSFSGIAAVDSSPIETKASIGGGAYQTIHINLISGSYFSALGVPAFLGRTIDESDDSASGAGPVAVASYAWFQRHLNGDPAALGKVIRIESHEYTLVGVAKPGFSGITVGRSADLWIPLSMEKGFPRPGGDAIGSKLYQSLYLIGRLKPGVTPAQAGAETNLLFKQIIRGYLGAQPSQKHLDDLAHAIVELTPGARGVCPLRYAFSAPLKILMTIVALVLLIACANIGNMLFARGVGRTREVAVRMALGASRQRIVFQLLTESVVLSVVGAAAGIALAWRASVLLLNMAAPGPDPVPLNLTPDLRVLAFTLGLTVLTALLFGTLPAFRATHLEFTPALKDGRGSSSVSTRGVMARSLIVGQVALSVLLMVVAGLFVRSLIHLYDVDTGFDPHNALIFTLDSSTANLPHGADEIRSVRLQEQIEERVRAIPGVQSDSFAFFAFNDGGWSDQVLFQGVPRTPANGKAVNFNITGNGFFSAMGIPLVEGRTYNSQDLQNSPKVAVINQTMARRFFPNRSAIGQHFGIGETPDHLGEIEVIGVVKDAKYFALSEGSRMAAYFPCSQSLGFFGNFIVRYAPGANRQEIVSRTRAAIAEINSNILVNTVTSLQEQVDRSIATQSLIARLSGFFGILAVLLACIGIYGLLSYSVARRTSELGIRVALGARSLNLLWMVMRECVLLLLVGLAIGVPLALSSTRVLKSLLYDLSPLDPVSISIAIAAVVCMTIAAAWLPARRASRIDPMQALRTE